MSEAKNQDEFEEMKNNRKTVPEQFGIIALGFAEIIQDMAEAKKNREKAK